MSAVRPPMAPIEPDTDVSDASARAAGTNAPHADPLDLSGESQIASATMHVAGEERSAYPRRHPLQPKHYLWIVATLVVIGLALTWLGPVLTPFLVGAILAYLGKPLVARAERRGIPRSLSTLFVMLFMGILLAHLQHIMRARSFVLVGCP